MRRRNTKKNITERNIPGNVIQMFELIERRKSKPKETSTEPLEVLKAIPVERNGRF